MPQQASSSYFAKMNRNLTFLINVIFSQKAAGDKYQVCDKDNDNDVQALVRASNPEKKYYLCKVF